MSCTKCRGTGYVEIAPGFPGYERIESLPCPDCQPSEAKMVGDFRAAIGVEDESRKCQKCGAHLVRAIEYALCSNCSEMDMRSLPSEFRTALDSTDKALADARAEIERLQAAKAKRVIRAIERICEKCGHEKTEDGCAYCLRAEIAKLKSADSICPDGTCGACYECETRLCPVCRGINEGSGGPPCPRCDDMGAVPQTP